MATWLKCVREGILSCFPNVWTILLKPSFETVYTGTMSLAMWYFIVSVISSCLVDVDSYGVMLLSASTIKLWLGFFLDYWEVPGISLIAIHSSCGTVLFQVVKHVCCAALFCCNFRQARPAQHLALVYIIHFKSKIPPNNGRRFMFWHQIRFCTIICTHVTFLSFLLNSLRCM